MSLKYISIKHCEHTDKIKDIKLRENYDYLGAAFGLKTTQNNTFHFCNVMYSQDISAGYWILVDM